VGAGHGVSQLAELGGEPAEDLGEREVGQRAVAEVEAVAEQDPPVGVMRPMMKLGEQPALADAGVAGDDDGTGGGVIVAREPHKPDEGQQLVGPADHRSQQGLR
jgi:hypothetical protein